MLLELQSEVARLNSKLIGLRPRVITSGASVKTTAHTN
jgi:hypothetical protein